MIRLRMKFRRMREVYWLEAIANTINTIEKVTPTTVIMEPAMVDIMPRAPSAPAPNSRGHRANHCSLTAESAPIKTAARPMLARTIIDGINQKLDRRLLQSCLNLFMWPLPLPIANLRHVESMLADIHVVFLQFVHQLLFQASSLVAGLRHAVDGVHHKMKTIEIVQHRHVEGRRDRAFFLVAANMQVVVVGASVGQLMNQRRIAVKREDDRLIAE